MPCCWCNHLSSQAPDGLAISRMRTMRACLAMLSRCFRKSFATQPFAGFSPFPPLLSTVAAPDHRRTRGSFLAFSGGPLNGWIPSCRLPIGYAGSGEKIEPAHGNGGRRLTRQNRRIQVRRSQARPALRQHPHPQPCGDWFSPLQGGTTFGGGGGNVSRHGS